MAAQDSATVEVRRADERSCTGSGSLQSQHSFSFGPHYDPANTHHGLLVANNQHLVPGGAGFDTHSHRDMEIVTWVMQGSLVHSDSTGRRGVIYPGLAQRMSAGTGIVHSEKNDPWRVDQSHDAAQEPAHFVQMWVLPDESGITPGYEQREVDDALVGGGLVPVASGMAQHSRQAAIRLHNRQAALLVARLKAGQQVSLPEAPYVHLFVGRGAVDLEDETALTEGDAARITAGGGNTLTAREPAEVLVWEMHASAAG
ncbi:MAG: pirin family protein [Nocardioidaceae bacterium]